jgi:Flp pilus assembly protein TadD
MQLSAKKLRLGTLGVALVLSACAAQRPVPHEQSAFAHLMDGAALDPRGGSESQKKAADAARFIMQMDLPRASRSINAALQLDQRDSWLHFLNGFIYHLQARQGDSQKNELAIEGYRTALRLDPGNWIAQEFLGLAYLDLKQFKQAKEQFAQALLLAPDTTVSMYGLMVTSYLTGDPRMACTMADQYRQHAPRLDAAFLRSSVSVYASCGNFDAAEQMRGELRAANADPALIERADQRLTQWRDFYRAPRLERVSNANGGALRLADAFTITQRPAPPPVVQPLLPVPSIQSGQPSVSRNSSAQISNDPAPANEPGASSGSGAAPRMVLVDVVIVSTQENTSTSKGINLLNALTLQLGSATASAYSWTFDSASANRTVITKAVTVPALAYSLNIANSNVSHDEVLARPTLAAIEGQPSEFFAGVNVNAGVLSTTTLGSPSVVPVDKRFGVKLAITPNFLADGMVKLKVEAQRTFVMPTTNNQEFAYRFDIAETTTDANVVMKMGDTLVLSGLSEKENSSSRDGVPGLQDVPGVQYVFSKKQDTQLSHSALILITPRSPIYAAHDEAAAPGGVSEAEQALGRRLGFPATVPTNVEAIVRSLSDTDLFRQFRQGDVAMERWDRVATTGDRLRQALSFLYY